MKNNTDGTVRDAATEAQELKSNRGKRGNILPKILCVLAAFVLWLYVMQTESPEYTDTIGSVSVSLENVTALQSDLGLSVYSGGGDMVTVKVSGKKSVISRLGPDDIKAFADVRGISEAGRHALDVSIELPEGVTLIETSPSTVTVYADETKTVSLNVKEKLQEMVLTSPYELGTVELEYNSITVTGPKTKIDTLSEAQVIVDMSGKTSSFAVKCPVTLISEAGDAVDMSYLTLSVSEMSVKVPIYITKEIPVSAVFKYGLIDPKLVKISLSPETITVRGDEVQFSDISSIAKPIEIDEKQITGNVYTMTVRPTFTKDVIVDPSDDEVIVTVELDSSLRTKQYTVTDIQVTGAPSGLDYEIRDKELTVTLRGTLAQLNGISSSDISVIVDLNGYDPTSTGLISKTGTVAIDSEDTDGVYEVGEYTVQIRIN